MARFLGLASTAVALGAIVKADDSDDAGAVVHLGLTGLAYGILRCVASSREQSMQLGSLRRVYSMMGQEPSPSSYGMQDACGSC